MQLGRLPKRVELAVRLVDGGIVGGSTVGLGKGQVAQRQAVEVSKPTVLRQEKRSVVWHRVNPSWSCPEAALQQRSAHRGWGRGTLGAWRERGKELAKARAKNKGKSAMITATPACAEISN